MEIKIVCIEKKIQIINKMLSQKFLGTTLQTPFMNAAGVFDTTEDELLHLNSTETLSVIISKSCTVNPREGNDLPRYYHDPISSINSTGLANHGYKFYEKVASKLTKKYIVSIASLDGIEGMAKIIKYLNPSPYILGYELNLSCPNIVGKEQPAYSCKKIKEYLKALTKIIEKPWGLKLPPYFDNYKAKKVAKILQKYKPDFITSINSIPLGLMIDAESETTRIKPNEGRGGLGGAVVKAVTLSNIQTFRKLLPTITIIGCGGITNGTDVFEHLLAGANFVQIGTQLIRETPKIAIPRIYNELKSIMLRKGYSSIKQIIPLCQRVDPEEPFEGKVRIPSDESTLLVDRSLPRHLSLPSEEVDEESLSFVSPVPMTEV